MGASQQLQCLRTVENKCLKGLSQIICLRMIPLIAIDIHVITLLLSRYPILSPLIAIDPHQSPLIAIQLP